MTLDHHMQRRDFLWSTGGAFGALALQHMLGAPNVEPHAGHSIITHRPKAKRVVQLFMNGGVSPMDTFDYLSLIHI